MSKATQVVELKSLLLSALVALVLVAACGEQNKLKEGEVVERRYDDPDSWLQPIPCGQSMCLIPMEDGPHWEVRVIGVDDEGKQRKEWHEVTESLFEIADIGVTVNFLEHRTVPK